MKNLILLSCFLLGCFYASAQNYVTLYYNPNLQAQVTANQAVRMASEATYKSTYEQQRKAYEDARDKLTQVVYIKNRLYDQLVNVNHALRQGRQVQFMYADFQKMISNLGEMVELSASKPQYSILISRFYNKIYLHALNTYDGVSKILMNEESDFLMDAYDRQDVLTKIHKEIRVINGWVLYINYYLKNADKKFYLRHIKAFDQWYKKDRDIIKSIIRKTNTGLHGW